MGFRGSRLPALSFEDVEDAKAVGTPALKAPTVIAQGLPWVNRDDNTIAAWAVRDLNRGVAKRPKSDIVEDP